MSFYLPVPPAADQLSAAAAAKRHSTRYTTRRANAKRLAKQWERRESLQCKQQAEVAPASEPSGTVVINCRSSSSVKTGFSKPKSLQNMIPAVPQRSSANYSEIEAIEGSKLLLS